MTLLMLNGSYRNLSLLMENSSNTTILVTTHGIINESDLLEPYENNNIAKVKSDKILTALTFPAIILFGTIGNLLTFYVMLRGSLKQSSTCFYMAMLALADTGKQTFFKIMVFFSSYRQHKAK